MQTQSNAFIYMTETTGRNYGAVLHYSGTGSPQGFRVGHLENSTTPRYDLAIDRTSGNVGVGTTSPDGPLHISKSAPYNGDTGPGIIFTRYSNTYGGCIWNESNNNIDGLYFNAFNNTAASTAYGATPKMVINSNGNVGVGTTTPLTDLHIKQSGLANHNGNGQSGIRFERGDNTNNWNIGVDSSTNFNFMYNNSSMGYLGRSDVSIISFTGQHRNIIRGITPEGINELQGLIVSANTNKYIKINNGVETGSNAITINESIPVVSLSNVVTDKTCFGVISASEDPEERSDAYGNFVTPFEKEKGDTRVFINSVGEGAIWVVNTNGSLESGDYITTSNVAGYGQKQDSEFLANYTVAKITMDCDFDPVTQPVQIIKKGEDEENVLDEHGQIQWEDHPTETEKAYKIRYLDASGVETDEANAVHKAAFVGCTYHCG
jgi:hypothetical protein